MARLKERRALYLSILLGLWFVSLELLLTVLLLYGMNLFGIRPIRIIAVF